MTKYHWALSSGTPDHHFSSKNCPLIWGDLDPRLTHGSLVPLESIIETAYRLVQPFWHSSQQSVPILHNGTPFPPQNYPSHKLATELSWQCWRQSMFSVIASYLSKVINFNLPHLQLVPPLGWVFEFYWNLGYKKTRVPGLSCGIVCMILHYAVTAELRLVTDRHMTMSYTTPALRRVVKSE